MALDTRLDRTIAIKVLPPYTAERPDVRQRFEREARVVFRAESTRIFALWTTSGKRVDGVAVCLFQEEGADASTVAVACAVVPSLDHSQSDTRRCEWNRRRRRLQHNSAEVASRESCQDIRRNRERSCFGRSLTECLSSGGE
jgi:hypothetical protein